MIRALRPIAVAILTTPVLALLPGTAGASGYTPILGAGSTWDQIAVNQWRADTYSKLGLEVNYNGVGSTAGRQLFIENQVDFANSEIPFLPDEVASLQHEHKSYQYLPIVAGGTSAMYNLVIGGQRVTNLQLSWRPLLGIFTGSIQYWDDPAIKADNRSNGLAGKLPHQRIIPVVRSDGSGTSAQFSAYLAFWSGTGSGTEWGRFCAQWQIDPCGSTSFWPIFSGAVGQKGSDGVANYVAASTDNGAIGYVEAGYALQRGFPVASILNKSGHYVQPTSANDSTALTHATFNADRTQNLSGVYTAPESTAYPISSYSYMITQTAGFDPNKGRTLGTFIIYFACAGQQEAAPLGYAPLPPNLVEGDFAAVRAIPGAPTPPPLSQCDNPTIPGHGQHGGGGNNNHSNNNSSNSSSNSSSSNNSSRNTGSSTSNPRRHGSRHHAGPAGASSSAAGRGATRRPLPPGDTLTSAEADARQTAVLRSVARVRPGSPAVGLLIGLDVIAVLSMFVGVLRWRERRRAQPSAAGPIRETRRNRR